MDYISIVYKLLSIWYFVIVSQTKMKLSLKRSLNVMNFADLKIGSTLSVMCCRMLVLPAFSQPRLQLSSYKKVLLVRQPDFRLSWDCCHVTDVQSWVSIILS